jgi:hypothetical protein
MGTYGFARDVFETAFTIYEAYGERLRAFGAHRHSHTALRIHQHYNRRFEHFTRTVPRSLGRGEGYGDTVVTFLGRADNAAPYVAAETLGLSAASLHRNTRSEMSLPMLFGGRGVGDLVAFADATHVGAASLAVGNATSFPIAQDARLRGDSHNEGPMELTMYGRLAPTMTTAVSRMRSTPDGDDGDNEPTWSLQLASSWARLDAACGSHALTESEPLDNNHSLRDACPATSSGASRKLRSRSPIKQRASCSRSLDGVPSLVPVIAFATDIFPKLQADISERINLLRFAKLPPAFSNRTQSESRCFVSRLGHGALAFLASDQPTYFGSLGRVP